MSLTVLYLIANLKDSFSGDGATPLVNFRVGKQVQLRVRNQKRIFLFLNQNICSGCVLFQ